MQVDAAAKSRVARAPLVFAGLGHGLFHILTALLPTVVLVLGPIWGRPYAELIALWTFGALLLGLGAPLAGWLADKWGEVPLMLIFFFGIGAATIACGFANGPFALQLALAAIGLFGAIYHPVGTAWVVKSAAARGKAIAIVGICGGIGVAAASLVAAVLTDLSGWRMAFIVPGVATLVVGLWLAWAWGTGSVVNLRSDVHATAAPDPANMRQTVVILILTMCLTSVIWYAFMTMLPKWLGRELGGSLGQGLTGLGAIVTLVYLVGTTAQLVGGHFADRGSAKQVYVAGFMLKVVAFAAALTVTGWPVVIVAALIAIVFDIAAPVENVLIARYASARRRGLAYGVRHGMAIVSAPLGVQLVAWLYEDGGGFRALFLALTMMALMVLLAALLLPADGAPEPATERATQRPAGSA